MNYTSFSAHYHRLRTLTDTLVPTETRHRLIHTYTQIQHTDVWIRQPPNNEALLHSITRALTIACVAVEEMNLGVSTLYAIVIYPLCARKLLSSEEAAALTTPDTVVIVNGLIRVRQVYAKTTALQTENFRKLLLSLAEDVRVIFIMLAERLCAIRELNHLSQEEGRNIARECSYLYAPLAHRMGFYRIKTEMEDLAMKATVPDIYHEIAHQLDQTKRSRDAYIARFIQPLKQQLSEAGFDCEVKGRTKSIYSIWNKLKKQNTTFDRIYDLFAIRIILNVAPEKEKAACWQVYSLITDMYPPNPARMRDWLSQPKANGYESLHTTVMGPEGKWVEVQIRTHRMDVIAEKGLAAHWKYKGIQGEQQMDAWLKSLREALEQPQLHGAEYMDEFKMNLYDEEVFVFTPAGDLHKLRKGAILLDFAYSIHTQVGNTCIGGRIGNKNVNLRYELQNGDQIEIITSPTQRPRADWLNWVKTSKAKGRIRQVIKEFEAKDAEQGRELLLRRFKNWKIDLDESRLSRLSKKLGFKQIIDLYIHLAQGKYELLDFREAYLNLVRKEESTQHDPISAQTFEKKPPQPAGNDLLIIDKNTRGIAYTFAKCCQPVYGDEIFGFVSANGGIKIHRTNCPNAPQMLSRYGYRVVQAAWEGQSSEEQRCSLHVVGEDDVSIIATITSLLSKEKFVTLRSVSVHSDAGLFEGRLVLGVKNTQALEEIIRKIRGIKGVTHIDRESCFQESLKPPLP